MKTFALWFASFFIRNHTRTTDPEIRARYGILEGWVSIVGNTLLFGIKLAIGLAVHSTALVADAVHTLADSATSAVVIVGFKMSQKPSDREHPFGHGRIEPVATLIISILLFVAGFELLKHSVHSILTPSVAHASYGAIAIIGLTVIAKELMARFSFVLGDLINSDTLKADALHHRSDVLATLLVMVALIASRFGYTQVDGIMGIGVYLVIFASAWSIATDAVNPLIGEAPSKEFLRQIEKACRSITDVMGVHDIVVHNYGENRIVSLHIEVSHRLSALAIHEIAEDVEEVVGRITGGMVVVHMDPINRAHPNYSEVLESVQNLVSEEPRVLTFHDLRLVGTNLSRGTLLFDITLADEAADEDPEIITQEIASRLAVIYPNLELLIKVSPRYSYNP